MNGHAEKKVYEVMSKICLGMCEIGTIAKDEVVRSIVFEKKDGGTGYFRFPLLVSSPKNCEIFLSKLSV